MTDSPVTVIKHWLPFSEQAPLFNALAAGPWHRTMIRGKQIHRKNIVFYEGDQEVARVYALAATDKEPPIPYADGPAELRAVRSRLQAEYGHTFSACYINYYEDESVGIGWHNDAEEIGSQIPVKMLCLGGTRTFSIRTANLPAGTCVKQEQWEETTESGDLVEMPIGFHEKDAYRHAVLPQKAFATARISLTFRSPDLSAPCQFDPFDDIPEPPRREPPKVWCCKAGHTYPEHAVYVGCKTTRGQKREGSRFGNAVNPMKVRNKLSNPWVATDDKSFREYVKAKVRDDVEFRDWVKWLRGKDLLCWCEQDGPKRAEFCHARTWLKIANAREYAYHSSPKQEQLGLHSRVGISAPTIKPVRNGKKKMPLTVFEALVNGKSATPPQRGAR
jgi:alkylated DNA repair dioxygenase AlkB